jgi:hypothetical protein
VAKTCCVEKVDSHLPLLAGSRLAALGYPPPPGLRASSAPHASRRTSWSEPAACATTNMRLRSPPVQRMSQGWSQRGPLRAAAARGAARHQRTRLPPTQCDAAAQLWVASCAAVMSSKVNAASSLRPLAGPPHAPATCSVCSACAFVAPTATREQAASWQEAKHNNALPAWAFQNSGSEPKSACHVKVSCCNCAARLRVPALAWRRALWRPCHHQLCQSACDSARLQHGLRTSHAEALAPALP